MSRRIIVAVLVCVLAIAVIGGVVVHWVAGEVLVAELDRQLLTRISLIPELSNQNPEANVPLPPGDRYIVVDADHRTVSRTRAPVQATGMRLVQARFVQSDDGGRSRTLTVDIDADGSRPALQVIYSGSTESIDRVLGRLRQALLLMGLASGVGAAAAGVWVARRALRPLHDAVISLGEVDERALDRRVKLDGLPEELLPVGRRLNDMLQRLEGAFGRQRQFLMDASHELRTPVAALLAVLEFAARRPRDPKELQRCLDDCLSDARSLRHMTEILMEHVRADGEQATTAPESIDLCKLLGECVTVARGLALERSVTVSLTVPAGLVMQTYPRPLRSIAINLLANAVEYNRPEGRVDLSADLYERELRLVVEDTGVGIAEPEIARIFDPFFRTDKRPGGPHLGLGLFLVQTHARGLGGSVSVQSTPGKGTRFEVRLPVLNPTLKGFSVDTVSSSQGFTSVSRTNAKVGVNEECKS